MKSALFRAAVTTRVLTDSPCQPRHFFIIGAMKGGTTSLYHYLAGRPHLNALKQHGNPLPDKQQIFTPALRAQVTAALHDDVHALFDRLARRITAWSDVT